MAGHGRFCSYGGCTAGWHEDCFQEFTERVEDQYQSRPGPLMIRMMTAISTRGSANERRATMNVTTKIKAGSVAPPEDDPGPLDPLQEEDP
jgi:hypothetical protein